ncbi:MAG TPA: ribose 5-phosphate isomerase A [Alphaproteobacteria bacterium]|nr:ribose 5-phosphate isomerase A [Alphaproteobacteria bacterium]
MDKNAAKKAAAAAAAQLVTDHMVVGLGTGSTAQYLVSILGERVRAGLNIVAIPTSEATRQQALAEGITIVGFSEQQRIDLTIDGADEIAQGTLDLIKGGGGALLREKIVASASNRMVVISDDSKMVGKLGTTFALPVEIVPFGWEVTVSRLRDRCPHVHLRMGKDGALFLTDGGHYIADCKFDAIDDPAALERDLDTIVGVVETGLFVGIAAEAFVAGADGVRRLTRS